MPTELKNYQSYIGRSTLTRYGVRGEIEEEMKFPVIKITYKIEGSSDKLQTVKVNLNSPITLEHIDFANTFYVLPRSPGWYDLFTQGELNHLAELPNGRPLKKGYYSQPFTNRVVKAIPFETFLNQISKRPEYAAIITNDENNEMDDIKIKIL